MRDKKITVKWKHHRSLFNLKGNAMPSFEDSNNPGYDDLMGKPEAPAPNQPVKSAKTPVKANDRTGIYSPSSSSSSSAASTPSFEETNHPGFDPLIMSGGKKAKTMKR